MRTNTNSREFETNGSFQKHNFTVQASSKAFQILSDQLYTDKPLAIIRELSTNALDGHIANGNQHTPFEVYLPTRLSSDLVVKDFGTGLSEEQVLHLYTTYFGSNKTHTDDLTGGLGLGSKSPFSYTDQFTVISRFSGVETTYHAFIDDTGIPCITKIDATPMGKGDTTGITISIPIKAQDRHVFLTAAERALSYFPVKPKIYGGTPELNIEYTATKLTLGNGIIVRLRKDEDYYRDQRLGRHARITQGPVVYPVDVDTLRGALGVTAYRVLCAQLDILCPVGTFDIVASREALSYSKKTINDLEAIAKEISRQWSAEVSRAIRTEPTYIDACIALRDTATRAKALAFGQITWNNIDVQTRTILTGIKDGFNIRMCVKNASPNSKTRRPVDTTRSTDSGTLSIPPRITAVEVFYRDKERPYLKYFDNNPIADTTKAVLICTGDETAIKTYMKKYGLTAKPFNFTPAKPVRHAGGKTTHATYGAHRYVTRVVNPGATGEHASKFTADELLEIVSDNDWDLYIDHGTSFSHLLVGRHLNIEPYNKGILAVSVPDGHTRVAKALKEKAKGNTSLLHKDYTNHTSLQAAYANDSVVSDLTGRYYAKAAETYRNITSYFNTEEERKHLPQELKDYLTRYEQILALKSDHPDLIANALNPATKRRILHSKQYETARDTTEKELISLAAAATKKYPLFAFNAYQKDTLPFTTQRDLLKVYFSQ